MKISSKDKQKLKGLAHSIKPSVIIGKEGASKSTINSINNMTIFELVLFVQIYTPTH